MKNTKGKMKLKKKKGGKRKRVIEVKSSSKWHRIELLALISLVIVLSGVFFINKIDISRISGLGGSSNLITGFGSSDVFSQKVDVNIDQSQEYYLSAEEEFTLTSLRLSGVVEGLGLVQIVLEDAGGETFLIYQNVKKKQKGNLITGYAVSGDVEKNEAVEFTITPGEHLSAKPTAQLSENQELVSGAFYQECVETCFLSSSTSAENQHTIIFYLEEGTQLKLNQLIYTIE